ncbi:hypothetical protein EBU94_06680 [bacterium]|nr:hypothetical protein [bacterium]
MKPSVSKFSWAEAFSNNNGKTSASAICGFVICIVGSICFLLGSVDKMFFSQSIDVITQSIAFVMIGASLLGLRKVFANKDKEITDSSSETPPSDELLKS